MATTVACTWQNLYARGEGEGAGSGREGWWAGAAQSQPVFLLDLAWISKTACQFICNRHANLRAIDMATFNQKKKLSKHIDMGSSFEDLVATDLIVKTVFQSDFLFKR